MSGVILDWKCTPYIITVEESQGNLCGKAVKNGEEPIIFDANSIKYGIVESIPFINKTVMKVREAAKSTIAACVYPKESPEEIWIFEANENTFVEIVAGKKNLVKAREKKPVLLDELEKALVHFQTALKITKVVKREAIELEQGISDIDKELFLQKLLQTAPQFLPSSDEKELFIELVSNYEDAENIFDVLELIADTCEGEPYKILLSAFVHERNERYHKAFYSFLKLSENNARSFACIEKACALLCSCGIDYSNKFSELLQDKFCEHLGRLKKIQDSNQLKCYIHFNEDEEDVKNWLEQYFISNLEFFGIVPITTIWDLNLGDNEINFEGNITSSDLLVYVSTPDLKKREKSQKNKAAIELINLRLSGDVENKKTYPIFLKGSKKEDLPVERLKSLVGTSFLLVNSSKNHSIFSNCWLIFELFSAMKEIKKEKARKHRDFFFEDIREILTNMIPLVPKNPRIGKSEFKEFERYEKPKVKMD